MVHPSLVLKSSSIKYEKLPTKHTQFFFYQQENNWSHSENCTTRKSNTYTTRQWHIHPLLDKEKALRAENCVQTIYIHPNVMLTATTKFIQEMRCSSQ